MAKAVPIPVRSADPISEINITPLIDVMLVLLIVLIISIPLSSHKVPLDLPHGTGTPPQLLPHRLDIVANGGLLWDGKPIADAALPGLLAQMKRESAEPTLNLRPDPQVRYERFDTILAAIKTAKIDNLGMIDQPHFD